MPENKEAAGKGAGRLDDYRRVHLVGIGGIGTSGVARLLLARGHRVSGSDREESPLLDELRRAGALVSAGHRRENLPPDADAAVYSVAVPGDNPEIAEARLRGLPLLSFSEALGCLMADRFGIAVAGTHGKTTMTSMVAFVLHHAGRDPGFLIGGQVPALGGNAAPGSGPWLVAEACEYRRNFLALRPKSAILTNLEEDHLDYYRDLDDIRSAFRSFLDLLPAGGIALFCRECPNLAGLRLPPGPAGYTYGFSGADFNASEIEPSAEGTAYRVDFRGRSEARVVIRQPGLHNVLNSLGAFALARLLDLPARQVVEALGAFSGVRRRMEYRGLFRGAPVYDDYGHHPAELSATLEGMRQFFPDRRLVVVFQPHQHSRTKAFLEAFADSLERADLVILPEIYLVRDAPEVCREISSRHLAERIAGRGRRAFFVPGLEDAVKALESEAGADDIILTIGAGPVYRVADALVSDR